VYDHSKTLFYTFTADGQYTASDSVSTRTESGKWVKTGENTYTVTASNRKTVFIYQPASNTIALADSPALQFYPAGAGSAIATPKPAATPAPGTSQQAGSGNPSWNPLDELLNSTNQTAQEVYHPAILNKK